MLSQNDSETTSLLPVFWYHVLNAVLTVEFLTQFEVKIAWNSDVFWPLAAQTVRRSNEISSK